MHGVVFVHRLCSRAVRGTARLCGLRLFCGNPLAGTFSKASAAIKGGGTAMFAMLALAGDVGCSGGPTLAGLVSSAFQNDLHIGILAAIVFPVLLLVSLFLSDRETKKA
mgnify:CR=1 FL=1